MRISGDALNKLRPVLTKALQDGAEVSFVYHDKRRNGPLRDFGWGPQGPFITIEQEKYNEGIKDWDENGKAIYNSEIKSFSLVKMSNLKIEQFVA